MFVSFNLAQRHYGIILYRSIPYYMLEHVIIKWLVCRHLNRMWFISLSLSVTSIRNKQPRARITIFTPSYAVPRAACGYIVVYIYTDVASLIPPRLAVLLKARIPPLHCVVRRVPAWSGTFVRLPHRGQVQHTIIMFPRIYTLTPIHRAVNVRGVTRG